MALPNQPSKSKAPPRWIGWLLWGLALGWIALGYAVAYGGFLLGAGPLVLYGAGFYNLSVRTSQPVGSVPVTVAARWGYLAAGVALVVALTHAAAEPDWYGLWYGGAAGLLALAFIHWPGTSRVGRAALAIISLLSIIGPAFWLHQSSLLPSIRAGSAAHVALLLRFGADANRLEQHDRPLIAAVTANRPDLVELLLQAGADPNGRTSPFMNSSPVLMDAARLADSQPLQLLLRYGANPNLTDGGSETALFHAARFGRRANVEALLAAGARPELRNSQGLRTLDVVQNSGDSAVIVGLLRAAGGTVSPRQR